MSMKDKKLVIGRGVSGFSLIEVLVALLILSVGLLGLAGLQGRGLRESNSALLRSQGVQYAEDILDRMRANRANATDYQIDLDDPDQETREDRAALAAALSGYAGIVGTDLIEWKFGLARSLPGGDGSVEVDGNLTTVVVQWLEGGQNQAITVVTRL